MSQIRTDLGVRVRASAVVRTEKASTYLQHLCRHFRLKVPAEFDAQRGRVDFKPGLCELEATANVLSIHCEAGDAQVLERLKTIVGEHLLLFGKRENLRIDWQSA
jgi:uncharacterized protein